MTYLHIYIYIYAIDWHLVCCIIVYRLRGYYSIHYYNIYTIRLYVCAVEVSKRVETRPVVRLQQLQSRSAILLCIRCTIRPPGCWILAHKTSITLEFLTRILCKLHKIKYYTLYYTIILCWETRFSLSAWAAIIRHYTPTVHIL